jgi:hypothetical protein
MSKVMLLNFTLLGCQLIFTVRTPEMCLTPRYIFNANQGIVFINTVPQKHRIILFKYSKFLFFLVM